MELRNHTKSFKFSYYDLTAIAIGLLLFLYFIFTARLSVGLPEEATFLSIPQRLLKGDRLFIEDWNLPQLSTLFSLLPFRLFVWITGGTEGILLFMRYVFIAVDAAYYCYMYYKLRPYKLCGVLSAITFCSVIPHYCLNYATVAPMAIMNVLLILFFGEQKKGWFRLTAAGMLYALAVVAEPYLILLYCIYFTVFLLKKCVRNKEASPTVSFLFCNKCFCWLTFGAFLVFLLLMGYLTFTGTLKELPSVLPYLFSGIEYNSSNLSDLSVLRNVVSIYGTLNITGILFCAVVSLVFRILKKDSIRVRTILFIFSCVLLICCYITCILKANPSSSSIVNAANSHLFTMLFVPLIWLLLCKKENNCFFLIWLVGFISSLLIDYSSNAMIGSCGKITQIAGFYFFGVLTEELFAEPKRTKKTMQSVRQPTLKKPIAILKTVCISMIILWNCLYIAAEGLYKPTEKYLVKENNAFSVCLKSGPYKNLITTYDIAQTYYATLRDLDDLRNNAVSDDTLFVRKQCPYTYLFADMNFGTFSAGDQDPIERHFRYWELLPKKRPDYVYISFYHGHTYQRLEDNQIQDELEALATVAEYETYGGEAGYILKITKWL